MPNDDFNAFDDRSTKKIAAAVARLKAQHENLHRELVALRARAESQYSQVRTAVTSTTVDVPVYPTDGCQFPFTITDLNFPHETGCPDTDKRPWTSEHIGRAIDGEYLEEGTEVLFVEIPTPDGHKFWLLPAGSTSGTIVFSLIEDRSREIDQAGKYFGQADAIVEAVIGDVPAEVGDTINVRFGGQRWLGAVGPRSGVDKGCEGIADYYNDDGDVWIVKECQELTAVICFTTDEDRSPTTADQDVPLASVEKNIGHANADYLVTNWKDISELTVRFRGLTYPYAFATARGTAILDVDIANTTDNLTMRYYVVECDQGAILNEVTHEKFCPGEAPNITVHEPATWFPFSQKWPDALIATAQDRMELASYAGGTGWIAYSDTIKKHVFLQTEHEEIEFMLTQEPQSPCAPQKLKVQAMRCEEKEDAGWTLDYAITSVSLAYTSVDAGGSGQGQACSSPKLNLNYKQRPFYYCGAESATITSTINLAQKLQTTDVYWDATSKCIIQEQTHVAVFESCDVITENVICTTDEQCSGA